MAKVKKQLGGVVAARRVPAVPRRVPGAVTMARRRPRVVPVETMKHGGKKEGK